MKYTRKDILTPANAITLLGLILTIIGCFMIDTWEGLAMVVIGRSMDLLDGPVARATKTTKFSVFFDPTADKIALGAIIVAVAAYQLVPPLIILYILVQNAVVAFLSIKAERLGKAVGALIPGKLNLFFQTCAIICFIIARLLNNEWSGFFTIAAYMSFIISLPLSFIAVNGYAGLLKRAGL